MFRISSFVTLAIVVTGTAAFAQPAGLPTTQPNLLQIIREDVKVGHAAEHVKIEAGWPAAFEKAKSPVLLTGPGVSHGRR